MERDAFSDSKERKYRFISPQNGLFCLIGWFVISFSCISYAYYHQIYPSRLMYIQPFLLNMDPERAHQIAIKVAQRGKLIRRLLGMVNNSDRDPSLRSKVWHLSFPNPIGMAAGFDKNGECVNGLLGMGFGFVEIGSVTPLYQEGNEKPRVFRLKRDKAVINRYGFNSDGHDCVRARLELRLQHMDRSTGFLGVNLGKNKQTTDENAVNDYIQGIEKFIDIADYLVINVSSPNTPGLRDLQKKEILKELLFHIKHARDECYDRSFDGSLMAECQKPPPPPLLVKVAPDLNDNELRDIAEVVKEVGIEGVIVANTTVARKKELGLKSKDVLCEERGGLSGKPLFDKSNECLRKMYEYTNGEIPLIGVGGIFSAEDAYVKIKCGASLVQLYTGLIYNGPVLMKRMLRELGQYMQMDGFTNIQQAVGHQVRQELGWDPIIIKEPMTREEQELMEDLIPIPQKSRAAKFFGVIHWT